MKKFLSAVVALCLVFVMSFSFTASAASDKIVWDDWDIEDGIVNGYYGTDTEIIIPNMDQYRVKINEVNANAFAEKAGITKIVVANGITTLHGACFKGMPDLTEVVFPSSLINLGYGSNLVSSPKLEKITLPGSLVRVSDGFAALSPKLKEVVFSYGIRTIGYQSFLQTALTDVVVPASVEQIESRAFAGLLSDEFTITICNPELKLGGSEEKEPMKAQGIFAENPDVKITIICPEGSTTAKYFTEEGLPNENSELVTKPQSYFDALPENQTDYGQQEVAAHYAPEGMEDVVHDGTKSLEEDAVSGEESVTSTDNGGNSTAAGNNTVTVESPFDFKAIITVMIIVFAAIILILIIVVVIVVVVRAQKKKKRIAAREAKKAAEAAAAAEVAEPADAPIDDANTEE